MSNFYEFPTQERIRSLLDYDSETGIFKWKVRKSRVATIGSVAGSPNSNGHIIIHVDTYRIMAHRLAWLYTFGYMPKLQIDHINRNPGDNRISNLRLVSQSENNINQGLKATNTSGYRGVRWNPRYGKYVSRISKDGVQYHLGLFTDIASAVEARNAKAQELYPRIPEAISKALEKA